LIISGKRYLSSIAIYEREAKSQLSYLSSDENGNLFFSLTYSLILISHERKYWLRIGGENIKSRIVQTIKRLIEHTVYGEGPTILVCHGISSNCFSTEVAKLLNNAGFSVLTPSRPGYGRTPASAGRTATDASMSIVALLDVLGIQRCSVIAISDGGPTGWVLAANYSQG
jgi:pimeloyl-ACP methyl ester carboxylesterase